MTIKNKVNVLETVLLATAILSPSNNNHNNNNKKCIT